MQPMTRQAVKKLQQETNHPALTLDDLDQIQALDELAKGFLGISPNERRILKQPFEVCGVLFYPLTVAKSLWYEEIIHEWDVPEYQHDALLFWVLSLPLNAEVMDEYSDREAANKAMRRFSRKLHCSSEELKQVYERCVGRKIAAQEPTETEAEPEPVDYGGMIQCLCKECGATPEHWLYEAPLELIGALFQSISDKAIREEQASNQKNKTAKAPTPSRKLECFAQFRLKVAEIRKAWSNDGP